MQLELKEVSLAHEKEEEGGSVKQENQESKIKLGKKRDIKEKPLLDQSRRKKERQGPIGIREEKSNSGQRDQQIYHLGQRELKSRHGQQNSRSGDHNHNRKGLFFNRYPYFTP
ncbi:MAG TPA: hypothetical protein PKZ83_01435 [bacterium]|nr:hypothetical protein [bacterium]HQJ63474.1 hypothetical protein [bacterium]